MSIWSLAYEGILDALDAHQHDGKCNTTYRKIFVIRVAERFNAHVAWLVSKPLILGEYGGVTPAMTTDDDDGRSIGTMHIRLGAIQSHGDLPTDDSNMPIRKHCVLNGGSFPLDSGIRKYRRLQGLHRRRRGHAGRS